MEIRKRFDRRVWFTVFAVVLTIIYIVVGLQSAEAVNYQISTVLSIPAIELESDVTELSLNGRKLDTPDTIVGSFSQNEHKTLLIGHSTTVFTGLYRTKLGDKIYYNDETYRTVEILKLPRGQISMDKVLAAAKRETLILMTCAGELYNNGDASHRLMVVAVKE